jgi:TRIAD3 protein (E3 ubiquitin-protein ligase RNF216)
VPILSHSRLLPTAARLGQEQEVQEAAEAEERLQKEAEENGTGIECGCCFGTYPFERCVQCEEGHLFW